MLDGVGSCVQTDTICTTPQQRKDVQCIMGRIRPIRPCKLTKFGCHLVFNMLMRCYQHRDSMFGRPGPQQCWKSCANGSTLLHYASAITEKKKCCELLAQNVYINKYIEPTKECTPRSESRNCYNKVNSLLQKNYITGKIAHKCAQTTNKV